MFYTYVLISEKDNKLYIGNSENIKERLLVHNSGQVTSTKHRIPFRLVYFEKFETRSQARWRERNLKSASGHRELKKILKF